jgi:hypothetical protein
MKLNITLLSITILILFIPAVSVSQVQLISDYQSLMSIPDIKAVESSTTHLYVLSGQEGLAVFRVYQDSLQWLFTAGGMQRRGNRMSSDLRFAYLFGDSNRLTVIEPTSVLGVYSSTELRRIPRQVRRIGNHIYLAMDDLGMGRLSLESPETVDSEPVYIKTRDMTGIRIIDVDGYSDQLFALGSNQRLFHFETTTDTLRLMRTYDLGQDVTRVFLAKTDVLLSDENGTVYRLGETGRAIRSFSVGEPVDKIGRLDDLLLIRGASGRIWTRSGNGVPDLFRDSGLTGNHFTVTKGQIWMSALNQVSRLRIEDASTIAARTGFRLSTIGNLIIPYPRPVLITLDYEGDVPATDVSFRYRSSVENANVRGNGFYWQPSNRHIGMNTFTIIGTTADGRTDSTSFNVEVRTFNAPPRFSPVRPISIPVGEPFTMPVNAVDPDGSNPDLIRYLGVDLPDGASLNENTGVISWTPNRRQEGTHELQVVATDQFGAASSQTITIRVITLGNDPDGNEQNNPDNQNRRSDQNDRDNQGNPGNRDDQ